MLKKRRIWLALLFIWVCAYHATVAQALIDELRHGQTKSAPPMSFGVPMNVVSDVSSEAYESGVRNGDVLETLDGRRFDAMRVLFEAVNHRKPGDFLPATVRSLKGTPFGVNIRILPLASAAPTVLEWLIQLTVAIVIPLSCLTLGFGIALRRPNDHLSWLLLAMLIGFSGIAEDFPIAALPNHVIMLAWWALFSSSFGLWTAWMVLFAILFPTPTHFHKRLPWLKWIWVAPPVLLTLIMALFELSREVNFRLAAFAVPFVRTILANRSDLFIPICAVVFFFVIVGSKCVTSESYDGRRRLRILLLGGGLGCAPLLTQCIRALMSGSDVLESVGPLEYFGTLVPLLLFPLTLAYVFMIRRAMDVRTTIRYGIQYVLAERGFIALETIITACVIVVVLVLLRRDVGVVRRIEATAVGVLLLVLVRRAAPWLAGWIDRRLFRTEYENEQTLNELTASLRTLMEEKALLETLVQRISAALCVPRIAFLLHEDGELRSAYSMGHEIEPPLTLAESCGIVRHLKVSQKAERLHFDDAKNWIQRVHPSEQRPLKDSRTEVVIPIAVKHQLLGILTLGPRVAEVPYTKRDLQLLDSLAIQAAFALENSRLAKGLWQGT